MREIQELMAKAVDKIYNMTDKKIKKIYSEDDKIHSKAFVPRKLNRKKI
jgi:phage pi2 protein 07